MQQQNSSWDKCASEEHEMRYTEIERRKLNLTRKKIRECAQRGLVELHAIKVGREKEYLNFLCHTFHTVSNDSVIRWTWTGISRCHRFPSREHVGLWVYEGTAAEEALESLTKSIWSKAIKRKSESKEIEIVFNARKPFNRRRQMLWQRTADKWQMADEEKETGVWKINWIYLEFIQQ